MICVAVHFKELCRACLCDIVDNSKGMGVVASNTRCQFFCLLLDVSSRVVHTRSLNSKSLPDAARVNKRGYLSGVGVSNLEHRCPLDHWTRKICKPRGAWGLRGRQQVHLNGRRQRILHHIWVPFQPHLKVGGHGWSVCEATACIGYGFSLLQGHQLS